MVSIWCSINTEGSNTNNVYNKRWSFLLSTFNCFLEGEGKTESSKCGIREGPTKQARFKGHLLKLSCSSESLGKLVKCGALVPTSRFCSSRSRWCIFLTSITSDSNTGGPWAHRLKSIQDSDKGINLGWRKEKRLEYMCGQELVSCVSPWTGGKKASVNKEPLERAGHQEKAESFGKRSGSNGRRNLIGVQEEALKLLRLWK